MKKIQVKLLTLTLLIVITIIFSGCSNMVVRPNASVDVVWGSHGPRVIPRMGVDIYGGGRH